ncbi:MAG: hypothetical protein ACAF41_08660 [Leptolyngbya sp. BL-A-14]
MNRTQTIAWNLIPYRARLCLARVLFTAKNHELDSALGRYRCL